MAHSSGGRLAGRPVGGWTSHRKNAPFLYFHTTRDTTWLAVGDQQGHNQYLQRLEIKREGYPPVVTKRFKLIDMGQMFGNFSWTAPAVSAVHQAYALPPHLAAKLTLAKLAPAIQAVKNALAAAIGDCFSDCPEEWNIPADDKQAGAQRAITAAAQIDQIIKVGNPAIQ